ncbi:hypothetical protein GQ55_3G432900 [Panicum hallii var. hallii]|uniref:Hydrophobic seed protein domain-containing protein n=1 Tax=Panicum hallii var. hallii TaxID=1504633 RepID=A0A2T7EHW8_9POAL|nr:hypothetical protein GQ55_3G432900 [Panicum hallii var. hallii]
MASSKSPASLPAALFLAAAALVLAASANQAQARPPAPAPAPSQAACPSGFSNVLAYLFAVPKYQAMGVFLSLSLYPPSSGLPGVVVARNTCVCYLENTLNPLGRVDCVSYSP